MDGEIERKIRIKCGQLVPELTEKQKQDAESVIKNNIEMSLDYIEKGTKPRGTKPKGTKPKTPKIINLKEPDKIQAEIKNLDVDDPLYAGNKKDLADKLLNTLKIEAKNKGYDEKSLSLDKDLNILFNGVSMGDVFDVDLYKVADEIEKGAKFKGSEKSKVL